MQVRFNAVMVNAFETQSHEHTQITRAALIWEAHQFLSRLVTGERLARSHISEAALHWLTERLLVHATQDDAGQSHLCVTERGRQALLGRQSVSSEMN